MRDGVWLSDDDRRRVRAFGRFVLRGAGFDSREDLLVVLELGTWMADASIPLTPAAAFDERIVNRFIAEGLPRFTDAGRQMVRFRLMRLASAYRRDQLGYLVVVLDAAQASRVLRVSPVRVAEWLAGVGTPDPVQATLIADAAAVMERASDLWPPALARDWFLHGRMAFLDGAAPADALQAGRGAEVIAALDAMHGDS